jgi:uncharacterized protein
MKFDKINRRRFLVYSLLSLPLLSYADAMWVEPNWLRVRKIRLTEGKPTCRVVQFTDLHHKGNKAMLDAVVKKINSLSPDFVCFTGDLVEDSHFLTQALEGVAKIKSPVYGVPGNHDYWSGSDFATIAKTFTATGGMWLLNQQMTAAGGKVCIHGATCLKGVLPKFVPSASGKNILLIHYPIFADEMKGDKYDLMLAGHSHGGQVRLPFYGPLVLPYWVGKFDMGLFRLPAGPLYVNPGIGWMTTPVRFNCRPEITVFDI